MRTQITTNHYWSHLYDEGRDFTLINSEVLSKILSFHDVNLPKNCLDIGCGTGQLTRELYHRGYTCIGIDASSSAICIAKSLTVIQKKLRYLLHNIEQDKIERLPEGKYSLITCKLVYAFIEDKPAFLKKVKQVLAPGGIFVIITPHVQDTPIERHNIAVSDNDLTLLDSYFRKIELYKGNEVYGALTYYIGSNV